MFPVPFPLHFIEWPALTGPSPASRLPESCRLMFESYGLLAVLLLVVGLIILVAEVFIPSGGVLAILTTITLCLSLACAYAAWYQRYPAAWWGFCGLVVLTIPTTLGSAFYIFPKTAMGRRVLLEAPDATELEPYADEIARLEQHIGKFGKTLTMLNPGGLVVVGNERLHAFSEGQMVDPGCSIEVLEIRGMRVLVRPGEPPDPGPQTNVALTDRNPAVDFDLPTE
ncbi:MAG: hypothetical protein B7Z55_06790 [Planctomycetales bacterium 12-60-4]|nr:MAG: hypothetical protein B7Z55_06790 [Planctomycetales bacterium 12-60-4]